MRLPNYMVSYYRLQAIFWVPTISVKVDAETAKVDSRYTNHRYVAEVHASTLVG